MDVGLEQTEAGPAGGNLYGPAQSAMDAGYFFGGGLSGSQSP